MLGVVFLFDIEGGLDFAFIGVLWEEFELNLFDWALNDEGFGRGL